MSTSPILFLGDSIFESLLRIAPEKEDNWNAFIQEYDPEISFVNEIGFHFAVDTELKKIEISINAAEYLWCASYTFYVIYQKYYVSHSNGEYQFDLNGDVELREAMDLYSWSKSKMDGLTHEIWNNTYPRPDNLPDCAESNTHVANELFLCAVGWILHHEMAHIYNNHPNCPESDEESREQEKEADASAVKWVFDNLNNAAMLKKRGLGLAVALLVITSQDIMIGNFDETSHPKSYNRLYDALDSVFSNPDDVIYVFSTVILHAHMALSGIEISINDNLTWKENFVNCLTSFEKMGA